jgi:hypothetical protein
MPASALGLRRVADRSPRKPVEIMVCRQANEAVLPFPVLYEAVIVAAVWAIARWRAPILGKFAPPGSCSA